MKRVRKVKEVKRVKRVKRVKEVKRVKRVNTMQVKRKRVKRMASTWTACMASIIVKLFSPTFCLVDIALNMSELAGYQKKKYEML